MPRVSVHRKAYFNAAHRLYCKEWDDKENFSVFGKCANPNYHGHNYELVVAVTGELDTQTGFVIDMKVLKKIIKEEIEERFDHKNLNVEVSYFKDVNPTAENIAIVIWNILRGRLDSKFDISVKLYETPRNFVIYSGE